MTITERTAQGELGLTTVLIARERRAAETRVAATPETVKRLVGLGCSVHLEQGAGQAAGYPDGAYGDAGAELFDGSAAEAADRWAGADVLLAVQAPQAGSGSGLAQLRPGALVMGLLDPFANRDLVGTLLERKLSAIALELLPRISRAQAMDALSSQANIAGYKAALQAAAALDRFFPMLMTAAGTVQPAKVVVLGAGVAGLQAVATARRLGALVKVSDVRPAAREQVESLGARFIEPPVMEQSPGEAGGYAKEAGAVFLEAQRQLLAPHLAEADVVITTALVPGRPAPLLITREMLGLLRPGAVVMDLAVAQGGNCAASQPDQETLVDGVRVIGAGNLPASVPFHASSLYARNLAALLEYVLKQGGLAQLDPEDPLINPCLITHQGQCRRADLSPVAQEVAA